MVFVKGALGWADFYLPSRDDDDFAGIVAFHQTPEFEGPVLVVVVGDGDAIYPSGFDLVHHLPGYFQRRRTKVKRLPDVGVQVQLNAQNHRPRSFLVKGSSGPGWSLKLGSFGAILYGDRASRPTEMGRPAVQEGTDSLGPVVRAMKKNVEVCL